MEDRLLGRLEALGSALLAAYMFYVIKASNHSVAQLAVVRAVLNVLIGSIHAWFSGDCLFVSWTAIRMSFTRGCFGVFTNGLAMASNKLLNISVYSVLSRMNTFGVILLSVVYLKREFTWRPFILGVVSVIGVTLIICPSMWGFDTGDNKGLEFSWTRSEILGLFTSVGFILANGGARTFTSKVSNDISVVQSVFYLNMFLGLFFSVVVIWEPIEFDFRNEWMNYLGMGAGLYGYQMLFTDSMRREPDPSMVSIIQTSLIIFTMMIDVLIMGSQINIYNIIGAVIVAITTVLAMIGK